MEIIIAIIGSSALSALVSGLFNLQAQKKKKDDGVRSGVRVLLYDRIKYLGRSYLAAGSVTGEQMEDLMEMHGAYRELGGNGYLNSIMEDVRRMNTRT